MWKSLSGNQARKSMKDKDKYYGLEDYDKGGFSKIFLANKKGTGDDKKFVIKRITLLKPNLSEDELKSALSISGIQNEIDCHKIAYEACPNCVCKFIESVRKEDEVWLILEPVLVGDLHFIGSVCTLFNIMQTADNNRTYPIELARHLMAPVLSALKDIHSKGIVHKDVKESNILLTLNGIPKLCDFGASASYNTASAQLIEERDDIPLGTAFYCAPEIVRGESFDSKVDTFSFGVTMISMLQAFQPFRVTCGVEWEAVNAYNEITTLVYFYKKDFFHINSQFDKGEIRYSGYKQFDSYLGFDLKSIQYVRQEEWQDFVLFGRKMLTVLPSERLTCTQLCNDKYIADQVNTWREFVNNLSSNEKAGDYTGEYSDAELLIQSAPSEAKTTFLESRKFLQRCILDVMTQKRNGKFNYVKSLYDEAAERLENYFLL